MFYSLLQPLFLYLPFQAVHSGNGDGTNLQAPKEYIDKFKYIQNEQRRIYAGIDSTFKQRKITQVYLLKIKLFCLTPL